MPKIRNRVAVACAGFAALASLTAGCGNPQAPMSKAETSAIHKPLGQPMPPEAAAAMAAHGAGGPPPQASKPK